MTMLACILWAGAGTLAGPFPLPGPPPALSGPAVPGDPLARIDGMFRDLYAQAKAADLVGRRAVLVVAGDRLALVRSGREEGAWTIRPEAYHRLKEVAHLPLALHLLLAAGPLEPARRARLEELRNLALGARDGLSAEFPPADRDRQRCILDACLRLADEALADNGAAPERRLSFARDLGPLLRANLEAAAGLELDRLHRQVARIRRDLGARDWDGVRVVIAGAHMARDGEIAWQYFSRLLGEDREGGRIAFAEGAADARAALDLLATHGVDAGMGRSFFDDPGRMHRDLLADGARRWLDAHFM